MNKFLLKTVINIILLYDFFKCVFCLFRMFSYCGALHELLYFVLRVISLARSYYGRRKHADGALWPFLIF